MSAERQPPPQAPRYEGRPLPRPEEEIVDQGLAFDVATLVSRRHALRAFGLGAAALGLAGCGSSTSGPPSTSTTTATEDASASASGEIPDETAGPFPGDGSNGADV